MLCDFTEGVEVASFLKLVAPHIRNRPPPPRKNLTELENDDEGMLSFRVLESGHTHNRFPGETRAQLDLTRLVSFYDIDMFPGLVESRYNQERFFHRPASIEEDGRKRLLQRLDEVLTTPQPPGSGVDWMSLIRVIKHRYADRLEILQYMLNKTENSQQTLRDVHAYTQSMLPQYLVNGVGPDNASSTSVQWASPVFQECASTHTKTVRGTLYPKLTYSERLILSSVDSTLHEICRVLVGLWADGVLKLELPEATALEPGAIVADWSSRINELTRWLDWSEWVKCRPECGFEVRLSSSLRPNEPLFTNHFFRKLATFQRGPGCMARNGGNDLEDLLRVPGTLPSTPLRTLLRIGECTAQAIPFSSGIENGGG
jgi:hypothetical protein